MKREDFVDVKIIQLQEIYQNVSAEYDLLVDEIPIHFGICLCLMKHFLYCCRRILRRCQRRLLRQDISASIGRLLF